MGPGPPSWGLGVGLTTTPRKKLETRNQETRKPEMW